MNSLPERIDECLKAESDGSARISLLGEKACYLARSGQVELATSISSTIRALWERQQDPKAMVWVMLIEGLVHYFNEAQIEAIDRIRRAQLISISMALPRMTQLTSAWMAHLEFNRFGYHEMQKYLSIATQGDWRGFDDVHLRVALVLGGAFLNCQCFRESQYWYEVGRNAANRLGDRLALAAIMYNRAIHGVNSIIVESIIDGVRPEKNLLERYALELDSAERFESIIGVGTFSQVLRLVRVRYLLAANEGESAVGILNELARSQLTPASRQYVRVLSVLCNLRVGGISACDDPRTVLADMRSITNEMDIDDRLVILSAGAEIALLSGNEQDLAESASLLQRTKLKYCELKAELMKVIAPFSDLDHDLGSGAPRAPL